MNACKNEWINQSSNQWNLPTSSSKSAPNPSVFSDSYVKSSSRCSPVHFFVDNFCRSRPETAERRPYFGDHGSHFTPKKRVSRPKLFSSLNSRDSRPVTLPNYLMMMLLTWWWECCPWQSSVTRKFSYQTSFDIQTLGRFGTGNKPGAARIADRVPTRTPNGASKSYSRQARIYVEYIRV